MPDNLEPASAGEEAIIAEPAADAGTAAQAPDQPAANEPASTEDPKTDESVHDYLMRNLTASETEETPAKEATEEPKDEPPANQETEPAEEQTPAEEQGEQEPAKPESETETSKEDDSIKIVTRAEIESDKYKRMPKEIRDVAAANADAAEAFQKRLEAYGGEHFAEPMQAIAKGLLEDDNVPVIHGILAAQGVDGFTGLMKDILQVSIIDTHVNTPQDEGAKYFKDACEKITEDLFRQRFGENASPALIDKLLKYDREGLLNTGEIDEYYKENGDNSAPSSLLKEKEEKIADLERKLELAAATETDAKAGDERRFAETWTTQMVEESTASLEDFYFKNSVLKPVAGDSPEMKAGKEQIKSMVLEAARSFQQADPKYKTLQAAAYRGNAGTAKYKLDKSKLVEGTVLHAKKVAAPLEALIASVYVMGRNANIPKNAKPAASEDSSTQPASQPEPKEPTQTAAPKREAMTTEEWNKYMTSELQKLSQTG